MNTLNHARRYIRRGCSPVPIPTREKAPRIKEWPTLRITEENVGQYFNHAGNIGIILGHASDGLRDVDLDCPEALELAPKYLSPTSAIFGRTSKPRSHRLYRVKGEAPSRTFKDPITGDTLVELRGDGRQTVFPPSIHPSGEQIEWETDGAPPTIDYAVLEKEVRTLAAWCLVARYLPGVTDDASLLRPLDAADTPVANRVREWLELPRSSLGRTEEWKTSRESQNTQSFGEIGPPPPHILERKREGPHVGHLWLLSYARDNLNDCVHELKNQIEPGRANLLFKKSIRMGTMIARGDIEKTEVANALYDACVCNGLVAKNGEADVRRQIERGLTIGAGKVHENSSALAALPSGKQAQMISATPFVAIDPAKIPPRRWLYGRHYIRNFVTATVAAGGVGKSAKKMTEAVSMAIGRDLFSNHTPISRLRVWYWNGEDPRDEIERRIAAICLHYKIDPEELEGWLFIDSGHDMPICVASEAHGAIRLNDTTINALCETIERNNIDVLILDPFIAIHTVSENNNPLIDQVVKCLGKIANQENCSIEIVHHVRKPSVGQHEVTADDSRGGGAIVNAVRSCQVFNRMSTKEAELARVEPDQRFRYIRIDSGKQNLAPPEKAKWRYLESVALPNGDNVQVPAFWQFPEGTQAVTPEQTSLIRSIARDGNYRWDSRANEWIGRPVAARLCMDADNKADKEDIKKMLDLCRKKEVIAVQVRNDAKRRPREFVVACAGPGEVSDEGDAQYNA